MTLDSKLPHVGTTIFTTMSQMAAKSGAINLAQGFPDFPAPAYLLERLAHHSHEGLNQYAPMAGAPPLLSGIERLSARCYQRSVDAESMVTVCSGATEGLFVAIQSLVHSGDEVIVFDPCYDSYAPAVELAGGSCVHIPLMPPAYHIDWQALESSITPRTRCIIVNSPHNPTATCLDRAGWLELERIVLKHQLWLISDEVYEHIVFDGAERLSASCFPALAERTAIVSSFGKSFHCTGWKLGYVIAPPALTAEFRKIHQYVTFSSFTPAQYAIADMLTEHPEHIDELGSFYQQKRDLFVRELAGSRLTLLPSAGTYFLLADYSAISDLDDLAFCRWLTTERGVAAIPLSVFYQSPPDTRIIRLCFAKGDDTLIAAAEKLCQL